LEALAPPLRGNRQHGRQGPLDPGTPGIFFLISHVRHSSQAHFYPPALL
jgi:hypothetical protein